MEDPSTNFVSLDDCVPTIRALTGSSRSLAMSSSQSERQSWPPRLSSPFSSGQDVVTSRPPVHPSHSPPSPLKKGRVSLRTAIKQKQIQEKLENTAAFVMSNTSCNTNTTDFNAQANAVTAPLALNQNPRFYIAPPSQPQVHSVSLPDLSEAAYPIFEVSPGVVNAKYFTFEEGRLRAPSGCSSVSVASSSPGTSVEDLQQAVTEQRVSQDVDDLMTQLFGVDGPTSEDVLAAEAIDGDVDMSTSGNLDDDAAKEKRDKHNYVEKKRRHNLTKQIEELEQLLPKRKSFEPRQTKNAVLKSVADYIKILKKEKEYALKQEAKQRENAEYYEKMCKELMIKLNSIQQSQ